MTGLNGRGPNKELAYFVSLRAHWFQDRREEIFRAATQALKSSDDVIVVGGLWLMYLPPRLDWPAGLSAIADAERTLLAVAPLVATRRGKPSLRRAPQNLILQRNAPLSTGWPISANAPHAPKSGRAAAHRWPQAGTLFEQSRFVRIVGAAAELEVRSR
jgi:hypothetical protein